MKHIAHPTMNPTAATISYKGNAFDAFVLSVSSPTTECMTPMEPPKNPTGSTRSQHTVKEGYEVKRTQSASHDNCQHAAFREAKGDGRHCQTQRRGQ
jgi:hypothetical protein